MHRVGRGVGKRRSLLAPRPLWFKRPLLSVGWERRNFGSSRPRTDFGRPLACWNEVAVVGLNVICLFDDAAHQANF